MPRSKPFLPALILLGLTLFGVAVCGPLLAQAATLYVATPQSVPAGNDATGNGTASKPYATIAKAITIARSGDTIALGDGTYSISATLALPPEVSLTSVSQNASRVTVQPGVDMSLDVPLLLLSSPALSSVGNQSVSHLTFQGINGSHKASRVWVVNNRNQVEIHHCRFVNFFTTANVAGTYNEQHDHSMIVRSTQIGLTSAWWYYWPADAGLPGDDTALDAGIQGVPTVHPATPVTPVSTKYAWPLHPVENFSFHHNQVEDCFPLSPYNLKNSTFHDNYVDNRGTASHWLKGTCAFLWNVSVTDNVVYGETEMDSSLGMTEDQQKTTWRIELWMHRGGCVYSRNTMDGWYSITVGKETTLSDNVLIQNPGTVWGTAIEFNQQSYSICSGNYISGAGDYGIRFASDGPNSKNWIYEHTRVYQNVIFNTERTPIMVQATGAEHSSTTAYVRHMFVYNNTIDGQTVSETGDASARGLYGIVIKRLDQAGICLVDDIHIKNNIVMDITGYAGSATGTMTNILVANNQFFRNQNNAWSGMGTVSLTQITDPLFVQPGANFAGYALQTTPVASPCINSGVKMDLPYNGSAPDRGAIESGGTASLPPSAPQGLIVR